MALFDYVFAAIPMLGLLILVHEAGHFVVAKLCGVRVLKFSIGFGSPIGFGSHRLRWERDGTEYVIAWFPLGGFVRMLGEQLPGDEPQLAPVPEDARPDEFLDSKPTWQKLAIYFAGPGMNLSLPVVLFMVMLFAGMPKTTSVVGMVEEASPAAEAGIEPGDRILAIDGQPVTWWHEVSEAIRGHAGGGPVEIEIERGQQRLVRSVPIDMRSGLDDFGEVTQVGFAGLGAQRLPALLGVPDAGSAAALAGLRSGDQVLELDGRPIETWEEWRAAYAALGEGASAKVLVSRGVEEDAPQETLEIPALGSLDALGVVSANILVGRVVEDTPAERAGLEAGDLILMLDGRPVGSFRSFAESVRASEGRVLRIAYARDGKVVEVGIQPEQRTVPGPFDIDGMEQKVYQVGITHALATLPGVRALDRERNPLIAFPRAVGMTIDNATSLLEGLRKLVTGELGTDQLRGPITIVQIARKSLDMGWQAYLLTMIFISINLGVLNLLPIPILDGGQILIISIEGIQRAPISLRSRELVQQIGFIVLVMLMGLAFWNDLSGQWTKFIEWLSTDL